MFVGLFFFSDQILPFVDRDVEFRPEGFVTETEMDGSFLETFDVEEGGVVPVLVADVDGLDDGLDGFPRDVLEPRAGEPAHRLVDILEGPVGAEGRAEFLRVSEAAGIESSVGNIGKDNRLVDLVPLVGLPPLLNAGVLAVVAGEKIEDAANAFLHDAADAAK